MNDKTSFERYVIEAFDREGPGRPVPDAIHDELITRAGRQRQWPTWLASVKEPPMRLSNANAVGSPTIRVAAIMAATLLLILALAVAGVAGKNLLAADGTIVVDPEGNGDFTTITEAVAVATDGDTVLLKSGTYDESIVVTKAVTIRGEDPETAVIEVAAGCTTDQTDWDTTCPPEVPTCCGDDAGPFGIALLGVDATVSNVHFHFHALADGVVVEGGSALLEGLSHSTEDGTGGLMVPIEGARVTIEDSDLGWGWVIPDRASDVTIEGSTVGIVIAETDNDAEPRIIRDNVIKGQIWSAGPTVIEGNEFPAGPERAEIEAMIIIQGGQGWVVRDNVFAGAVGVYPALEVQGSLGSGTIEGNTFTDNEIALTISNDSLIRDNTFTGGDVGIRMNGGAPELIDNTVENMSDIGVSLAFTDPILTGNRLCGSPRDLFIGTGSEPVIADDNDICVTDSPE
jgi:nitrous oxidase accessory protein NosD